MRINLDEIQTAARFGPAGMDPLPFCMHGSPLLDGGGEILAPRCRCRWKITLLPEIVRAMVGVCEAAMRMSCIGADVHTGNGHAELDAALAALEKEMGK